MGLRSNLPVCGGGDRNQLDFSIGIEIGLVFVRGVKIDLVLVRGPYTDFSNGID